MVATERRGVVTRELVERDGSFLRYLSDIRHFDSTARLIEPDCPIRS